VGEEGEIYGTVSDENALYNEETVRLDLTQLRGRLKEVDPEDYYPLIETE